MARYTILAVALGESTASANNRSKIIRDGSPGSLRGVRPYIVGLINWLGNQPNPPVPHNLPKYLIGDSNDYVIDYRECSESELSNNFTVSAGLPASYVILCMSTTVAREAYAFSMANNQNLRIVAIVSDPFVEPFAGANNVCGVSARRPGLAVECYQKFRDAAPSLGTIYALHKDGYSPSDAALNWLGNKVTPWTVRLGDDIQTRINSIPAGPNRGLLVLPADRFFGAAENIATWARAQGMLDYWSVPDWPPNSFGGCGFPQQTCGHYLAERIASIWSTNTVPNPKWVPMPDNWIDYRPKIHTWWQLLKARLRRAY